MSLDRLLGSPTSVVILLGLLCAVMWALDRWDRKGDL
jgi:hypothetical protein